LARGTEEEATSLELVFSVIVGDDMDVWKPLLGRERGTLGTNDVFGTLKAELLDVVVVVVDDDIVVPGIDMDKEGGAIIREDDCMTAPWRFGANDDVCNDENGC